MGENLNGVVTKEKRVETVHQDTGVGAWCCCVVGAWCYCVVVIEACIHSAANDSEQTEVPEPGTVCRCACVEVCMCGCACVEVCMCRGVHV